MRILNMKELTNHGNLEGRKIVADIMETGLEAADPYYNTLKLLHVEDGKLHIGYPDFEPIGAPRTGEDVYDLEKDLDRIFVFGAGKGIQRVVKALEEVLGDHLTGGHVVAKHGDDVILTKVGVTHGGHPVPDIHCVEGCSKIVDTIKEIKLTSRDLVFTVVGNGVSSLLTMPVEGVELEDVMSVTRIMQIQKGLPTFSVNFVRNQLDQLKGGRITRMLAPAKMVHIVAIDVNERNSAGDVGYVGLMRSNIWLHTLPDMSTAEEAIRILKVNDVWDAMPSSIREYLQNVKPEADVMKSDEFEKLDCRIYGVMPTHLNFLPAAMERARQLGYEPHLITRKLAIEAGAVGAFLGRMATTVVQEEEPFKAPCALIMTGEMIVTVGNYKGVGGRNQECALSGATVIKGNRRVVLASSDTDGTDGPGGNFDDDAWVKGCNTLTGGIVDGYTMSEAQERGVDIAKALKEHATSQALWKLDAGMWATQNISVQDLLVVLVMDHDG